MSLREGRRLLPPIEETGRRGISGRSPVALKFKLERRPTIINRIKQYLSPPTPKELPYQSYKQKIAQPAGLGLVCLTVKYQIYTLKRSLNNI